MPLPPGAVLPDISGTSGRVGASGTPGPPHVHFSDGGRETRTLTHVTELEKHRAVCCSAVLTAWPCGASGLLTTTAELDAVAVPAVPLFKIQN